MTKEFYEKMFGMYKEVLYMNECYDGLRLSHESFRYNIEKWEKNKRGLIDRLSAHPNYNEKEHCIIIPTELTREPDYKLVNSRVSDFLSYMYNYATRDISDLYRLICDALMSIDTTFGDYAYDKDIDWGDKKDLLDTVVRSQDFAKLDELCKLCFYEPVVCRNILFRFIKYRPEQHIGKLFDKLLGLLEGSKKCDIIYTNDAPYWFRESLGRCKVDKFGGQYFTYNQIHDYLKDLLVPNTFKKYLVISCNPIDYLTQSHLKSGSSCHSIKDDGCYHGATLTSLTDPSTIICYVLDSKDINLDDEDLSYMHTVFKDSRVLCNYGNGLLIVNQMYPQKVSDERSQIISILKEVFADNIDNWDKVDMTCNTYHNYVDDDEWKGYNDFLNGKKALFLINSEEHNSNSRLVFGSCACTIDDCDCYVAENGGNEGTLLAYDRDDYYDDDDNY